MWNPCFTRFFVEVFELTFPSKRATKTSRNVYKHPLTWQWAEWIYKHEHLLLQGFQMELLKCSKFQRKKTKRSKRFIFHKSHDIICMQWKRVYGSLASTPNCKIILFFWIRKISIWLFHCNSSHIKPIIIPKDYKPSSKVLAMTCGPLPKDFDLDQELDKMWEERAKWMCLSIQMSL